MTAVDTNEATSDAPLIHVEVKSAGLNAGNFAEISVNQKLIKLDQNENGHYRGLHIVIINPHTGKVSRAKVFDTYKSAERFDEFISSASTI